MLKKVVNKDKTTYYRVDKQGFIQVIKDIKILKDEKKT
tara:strand:+ start:1949 stop:2062 length:114 start_codon:yes stop_codon:yes gene_type:complete